MASDETITIRYSSMLVEEDDDEYDHDRNIMYDGDDDDHHRDYYHHHQLLNLSRLSVCSTNSMYGLRDDEHDDIGKYYEGSDHEEDGGVRIFMSKLSMESFDGDADELSDIDKEGDGNSKGVLISGLSSDSVGEPRYYSLPSTPARTRRRPSQSGVLNTSRRVKDYASENDANRKGLISSSNSRYRNKRRKRSTISDLDNKTRMMMKMGNNNNRSGGESESGGSGSGGGIGGVMVITRPKGGRRTLCMDMEEVRACRDLGFELEHERMLESTPSRLSNISVASPTQFDAYTTSSGGNSPISSWCISSPGDDPKDVKARLKVWAQAVAIASTTTARTPT